MDSAGAESVDELELRYYEAQLELYDVEVREPEERGAASGGADRHGAAADQRYSRSETAPPYHSGQGAPVLYDPRL